MQVRNMWGSAASRCLLTALVLLFAATGGAQICDPGDMPAPTVFADTLLLPTPEWTMTSYYPAAGTYIEQIETALLLDNWFPYFGIAADQEPDDEWPAHYFLPPGWRTRDLIAFEWQRPRGSQIVREPVLRSGAIFIQDPAFGTQPDDTMSVSPQMSVRGEYTGDRDQRIIFEWSFGNVFQGDQVMSELDPGLVAWDVNGYSINDTLWFNHPSFTVMLDDSIFDIGDTLTLSSTISWKESYGPDEEFGWAPGDEPLDGKIALTSSYLRTAIDHVELVDDNLSCAHGLFPDSWYPAGEWDPETDPSAYGLYVSFSPGMMLDNFRWNLVVEDFAGYQVWRRVEGGNGDWVNHWKISRQEERDKFYWWVQAFLGGNLQVVPIFGATDERVYLDFDVHNGFEYSYALTTYDRGFRPNSGESDHYILSSVAKADLDEVAKTMVFNEPAGDELSRKLYAVPNPLRTGKSAFDDPNYHNFPGKIVRFVGVTANTVLKVYTVAGDLVFEAENSDPDTANIIWDTRNQAGKFVASGVYIFRAEGEGEDEEFGKLIIIR
jgi:hypothetical protein